MPAAPILAPVRPIARILDMPLVLPLRTHARIGVCTLIVQCSDSFVHTCVIKSRSCHQKEPDDGQTAPWVISNDQSRVDYRRVTRNPIKCQRVAAPFFPRRIYYGVTGVKRGTLPCPSNIIIEFPMARETSGFCKMKEGTIVRARHLLYHELLNAMLTPDPRSGEKV